MFLTVITINRNNAVGLQKTLRCLSQQSYSNFEQVVVDGNSSDGSKDVIVDPEFMVHRWVSEADTGIYNAMNKAIAMASGSYLLFLNSGDELIDRNALAMAVDTIKGKDFYYFATEVRPNAGGGAPWIKYHPEVLTFSHFFKESLPHQSTFIKSTIFTRYGLYDETLRICADWKHFMICICRYNCSYHSDSRTLGVFYLDGISSNPKERINHQSERNRVLAAEFPAFIDDTRRLFIGLNDSAILKMVRGCRTVRLLKKIGLLWNF